MDAHIEDKYFAASRQDFDAEPRKAPSIPNNIRLGIRFKGIQLRFAQDRQLRLPLSAGK
jgi:hypothetical protein